MARTPAGPARPPLRWLLGVALLTLFVGGAGLLPTASAATITVSTFEDQFDDAPPCSLREAIASANSDTAVGGCTAGSGADTIVLGAGEYHVRLSSDGFPKDGAASVPAGIIIDGDDETIGDLDVTSDVTILGAGSTAIDGAWTDDTDRIIELHTVANGEAREDEGTAAQAFQGPTLILEDLTVQDGEAGGDGGGILVDQGHLIATNVVVDHNSAPDGAGGGLAVFGDSVADLTDVTLIRNLAEEGGAIASEGTLNMTGGAIGSFEGIRDRWPDRNATNGGDGGGIANFGTANLVEVSLVGNLAFDGDGGGIWNAGTITVERSLLFSNHAQFNGGGFYETSPQTTTMTNVTVSGNTANDHGGGGYNEAGEVHLTNVTVAFNRADEDNDDFGDGGGLFEPDVNNTTTLRNTIVAGNVDKSIEADRHHDCSGPMTSEGTNLVQQTEGCTGLVASDLTGVDPLLGPLGDNGGPTFTHELPPGSPALDRASGAPAVDQRGVPRPFDHPRLGRRGPSATADIGAYERFLCFGAAVNVVGTDGNDTLDERLEPPLDVVLSLGGDDTVFTGPSQDRICSGAGNDRLLLGSGRDKGDGQEGNDILRGGGNPDLLKGGPGKDDLFGGGTLRDKGDRCKGGPGKDQNKGCERGRA
ncbi:MAG: choice-of-anchor Q domain-containing protein [Actinomycetota bacterium]